MKISLIFLSWVTLAVIGGIAFGYTAVGLTPFTASISLSVGLVIPIILSCFDQHPLFVRMRSVKLSGVVLAVFFFAFALRAFSSVVFVSGDSIRVLSPNNLGDLCLHLTQINYLANNPHFWPGNPIYAFDQLHYPIGINLFNAELKLVGLDPQYGLILVALAGSILVLRALFLFAGPFGVAAFLFNGGLAGLAFFQHFQINYPATWWHFADYQDKVDWKSIPLAMLVTQRTLLYAIPAGLLLLVHWRSSFAELDQDRRLPFWGEWLLYSTMPLFHIHTFLFLSFLLFWWFIFGNPNCRLQLVRLIAFSIVPASISVYLVSGFHQANAIAWDFGWMNPPNQAPWSYWFRNFGFFLPFSLAVLVRLLLPRSEPDLWQRKEKVAFFFVPAAIVFVACSVVRFAPWNWDNTKLFLWAYLLLMYAVWSTFLRWWPLIARIPAFLLLFFSGFFSLAGGIQAFGEGYEIGRVSEWTPVEENLSSFAASDVFAVYPTWNHPVLVTGHRVVLGYPGHIISHGLDLQTYEPSLDDLMNGESNWRELARALRADYLFWGRMEEENYPDSFRPWENSCPIVAQGDWGKIFDLRKTLPGKQVAEPSTDQEAPGS